jgi:hypothetical protein
LVVFGVLVLAYFVLFPQDIALVLNPVEKLLGLSNAVSLGAYLVLAVAILRWTALRIWGTGSKAATDPQAGRMGP